MTERESTLASVRRGKERKAGRMEGAAGNGAIWPFFLSKRMCGRAGQESSGPAFKPQAYHLRSARVTVRGR